MEKKTLSAEKKSLISPLRLALNFSLAEGFFSLIGLVTKHVQNSASWSTQGWFKGNLGAVSSLATLWLNHHVERAEAAE